MDVVFFPQLERKEGLICTQGFHGEDGHKYAQPRWEVLYSRVEYVTRTLATRCIFDVHTERFSRGRRKKKGGDEHLASYFTYLDRCTGLGATRADMSSYPYMCTLYIYIYIYVYVVAGVR